MNPENLQQAGELIMRYGKPFAGVPGEIQVEHDGHCEMLKVDRVTADAVLEEIKVV